MATLSVRWHRSIRDIPHSHWDHLLGANLIPFYQWSWLEALEASESIAPDHGWQPLHLALWREDVPVAVAPLYLKGHSYGEFVFDQNFVYLAADMGLNYYPKLLGMSPVSPVQGYRFFVSNEEDESELTMLMMQAIDELARKNGILSCNFLYVDPAWRAIAEAAGCAVWLNQQSLWSAEESKNFEDYLACFNANQRKNIKKERRAVHESGVSVTALTGEDLDRRLLKRMHSFYQQHCARWGAWGSKYLSESFFENLANPLQRNKIVLFSAHRGDPCTPLAMSMCVHDSQKLWGRYWGTEEDINCLHFEVCYYSPIQWALERGIQTFDPGAGGGHKRRRGFVAQPVVSLHRWYHPGMDALIRAWLPKANDLMMKEIEAINADLPFRVVAPPLSFVG